jgi:hypothetical protein
MTATPPRLGGGNVPSYDAIAEEYAEKFFDELDGKPFDREVLDRFAASVKDPGPVCDLGCGPGQIARYLAGRGVGAFGIDASVSMAATARRLNPTLDFRQVTSSPCRSTTARSRASPPSTASSTALVQSSDAQSRRSTACLSAADVS